MKKKIFSQDEIQSIIDLYLNYNTLQFIGEQFNVDRSVIRRILIENNIELRRTTSKYHCNTMIFSKIDTSEKAYWLGFFAADGINYRRATNATIGLNLHRKDRAHLEKFREFCNSDSVIVDYIATEGYSNNTPMSKLILYSTQISDDLTKHGVPPRKSLILQPPNIDEQYYLSFICGYFDGDGSISKSSQSNNYNLTICGTQEILNWINDILKITNHLEQRIDTTKNSYYIRCGGTNKPYNILKKLYSSCTCHLDRKYELYKELETVVLSRNI